MSNFLRSIFQSAGKPLSAQQYKQNFLDLSTPHTLVDVRTSKEFSSGHIAGAINIELQSLMGQLHAIATDLPIVLYCRSGSRSCQAAYTLQQAGYTEIYDLCGLIDWQAAGFDVET
jgi:rhodanese-related sulfurtransferase